MLVTSRGGEPFATDYGNGRTQRFDQSGKHLATYLLPGGERFEKPWRMDVGSTGDLFVAEVEGRRIQRLGVR